MYDMGRSWEKVSVSGISDDRRGYVAVDQWWVEKCVGVQETGCCSKQKLGGQPPGEGMVGLVGKPT